MEEELAISWPDLQVSTGRKDICQLSPCECWGLAEQGCERGRALLVLRSPTGSVLAEDRSPLGHSLLVALWPMVWEPVTWDTPVSRGPEMLFRKTSVLWIDSIQAGLKVAAELLP